MTDVDAELDSLPGLLRANTTAWTDLNTRAGAVRSELAETLAEPTLLASRWMVARVKSSLVGPVQPQRRCRPG